LDRDHAGLDELKAVEEPGDLFAGAVALGLAGEAVVPTAGLGHLLGLDVGGYLGQHQVAAGCQCRLEVGQDPVRVVFVRDQVHDGDQQDRYRPAEVERLSRRAQDLGGVPQVRVDVVDGARLRAGKQHAGVLQDHRVVVHVGDASVRRDGLRDLVRVVRRGDAGADIEELGDPGVGGEEAHGAGEERPVGAHRLDDARVGGHDRVARCTVGGEVVFAAEPVIMHPGAVRHAGVNTGLTTGAGTAAHVHEPNI
jgi:hypothetical protein